MLSEQTISWVHLVFTLAVWAFEGVGARFTFLGFEPRWVSLIVSFAAPRKLLVINRLVGAITLDTFRPLDFAHTWCMTLFPTVFTLWHSRVHVYTMNCGDEATNVEPPVDKTLSFGFTLCVPDINPDDRHIRFGWHLDDSWFGGQNSIIEDVVVLQNFFHVI